SDRSPRIRRARARTRPAPRRGAIVPAVSAARSRTPSPRPYSFALQNLDLLRVQRLDPRAAPLFFGTAQHPTAALQPRRGMRGPRKAALIALGDGHHEIFRPAPAEIHEDGVAAFPDRQHLALDDGEAAAFGRERRRLVRPHDAINGFRPHPESGVARLGFPRQELARAGEVTDPRGHPGLAASKEIRLDPALGPVFGWKQMDERPPVAVLLGPDLPQGRAAGEE